MAFHSANIAKTDLAIVGAILGVGRHADIEGGMDVARLRVDVGLA